MLSLICNRASICKQSVKALMGISTEIYSDKIDINFIDVNAKSLWPFSTFVNQVLKYYSHFACSERLRKFPIKYGDLYIRGRGVRKLPVQYWHCKYCCIWIFVCCNSYVYIMWTSSGSWGINILKCSFKSRLPGDWRVYLGGTLVRSSGPKEVSSRKCCIWRGHHNTWTNVVHV